MMGFLISSRFAVQAMRHHAKALHMCPWAPPLYPPLARAALAQSPYYSLPARHICTLQGLSRLPPWPLPYIRSAASSAGGVLRGERVPQDVLPWCQDEKFRLQTARAALVAKAVAVLAQPPSACRTQALAERQVCIPWSTLEGQALQGCLQ